MERSVQAWPSAGAKYMGSVVRQCCGHPALPPVSYGALGNAPTPLAITLISMSGNSLSLNGLLGGLNRIIKSHNKLLSRYYYTSGTVLGTVLETGTQKGTK